MTACIAGTGFTKGFTNSTEGFIPMEQGAGFHDSLFIGFWWTSVFVDLMIPFFSVWIGPSLGTRTRTRLLLSVDICLKFNDEVEMFFFFFLPFLLLYFRCPPSLLSISNRVHILQILLLAIFFCK